MSDQNYRCDNCNREFPRSSYYRHIHTCGSRGSGQGEKRKRVVTRGVSWKRYKVTSDDESVNKDNTCSNKFSNFKEGETGTLNQFSSIDKALEQ